MQFWGLFLFYRGSGTVSFNFTNTFVKGHAVLLYEQMLYRNIYNAVLGPVSILQGE